MRLAQHLAPLAERGLGRGRQQARVAGVRRSARQEFDHAGDDLGRRGEGGRRHVEQDPRLRAPAGQHGKPAVIGALGGRCDDAQRDLALEHQRQAIEERRPRLGLEPTGQEARADVIGEIGADADRRPAGLGDQHFRRDGQGVGRDHLEAAWPAGADLGERRQRALVALDGDDGPCACGEERPGQAARGRGRPRPPRRRRAARRRARSWR